MENKIEKVYSYHCDGRVAIPINPYNEKYVFGYETFLFEHTQHERTKILRLYGHQELPETEITKQATYELNYNCPAHGSCSNCNGVSCSGIFLRNKEWLIFEEYRNNKSNHLATSLIGDFYSDEVEIVEAWIDLGEYRYDIERPYYARNMGFKIHSYLIKKEIKQQSTAANDILLETHGDKDYNHSDIMKAMVLYKNRNICEAQKWISVSDLLPQKEVVVLVYSNDYIQTAYLEESTSLWVGIGNYRQPNVTHWMELPKKPIL